MIILEKHQPQKITTAVFDFDGTLSTLRCGWETVMAPMMTEYLSNGTPTDEIIESVNKYIDESTGIQTIIQMKWLAAEVERRTGIKRDPWFYKDEYNARLMKSVALRRDEAKSGQREKYLIKGSEKFLASLKEKDIKLFAASGTDEVDVKKEADALGISGYFDLIAGAGVRSENCSKEETLKRLITSGVGGIIVIGDGPVEIKLGRAFGTLTLGVAADEKRLCGYSDAKISRLTAAKAHALCDSFENTDEILGWMED